jgi:hypothetical protein
MMNMLDSLVADSAPSMPQTAPQEGDSNPLSEYPGLAKIASGEVPGAYIPADVEPRESNITPDALQSAGLLFYKPKTPNVLAVLFNPEVLPAKKLKELDLGGQLTEALPPITQLMGAGDAAETPSTSYQSVEAPETSVQAPSAPETVPVLPAPTFGVDAQRQAARTRLQTLAGQEPSKRPIPGGGQVLNGLLRQVV